MRLGLRLPLSAVAYQHSCRIREAAGLYRLLVSVRGGDGVDAAASI